MNFLEFTKRNEIKLDKKIEKAISVQIGIAHKKKMWVMALTSTDKKLLWLQDIRPEKIEDALIRGSRVVIISSNVVLKNTLLKTLSVDVELDSTDNIFWIIKLKQKTK